MDWVQQNIVAWNELADTYAELYMEAGIFKESYDALATYLPEHSKMLEIACGPGNIYSYLNKIRPDLEFLLTDSSEKMLEVVSRNFPKAKTKLLSTRDFKTLNTKYDALIAGFVVPYIDSSALRQLMLDVSDLLCPDGYFYLSYILGSGERIDERSELKMKQYRYSKEDLDHLIKELDWKVCKDYMVEDDNRPREFYRILILQKP